MYVKVLEDGNANVYTIAKLKADNPNVSFPKSIPNSILQEYNVYPCIDDPITTDIDSTGYDEITQTITSSIQQVDGVWHNTKTVTNYDEVTAASNVRRHRDKLLAETDWLGASDVTMSTEWATYRQALRDIPQQDGFPFNVTYPTKPE